MERGLGQHDVLRITGVSRHQLYYRSRGKRAGRRPSAATEWLDVQTGLISQVDNAVIVDRIRAYKSDPDQNHYYKSITVGLRIEGYHINHKKVYRLMKDALLLRKPKRGKGRKFVRFRRVCPSGPLRILEMDIKYYWVGGSGKYAYVLTIIDTFTRYALGWDVGFEMKQLQVRQLWEQVIATYFQGVILRADRAVHVEIRNDNGKQFSAKMVQDFFAENYLDQVFTHPYTPEENAHVESFHKTIGGALKNQCFESLNALFGRLEGFYATYNNTRLHGSIAMLSPAYFWTLYEQNQIEVIRKEKRQLRFKLRMDYRHVKSQQRIDKYFYPYS